MAADEYADVHFTTDTPEELKCILCQFVLCDPVQIMSCGHRFCSHCFDRLKSHAQHTNADLLCPVDREVVHLNLVFPDKAVARTIGNLQVQCRNHNHSCCWIGDLRDLKNHEGECEFKVVVGIQKLSVGSRRDEEVDALLKKLTTRLENCENDLIAKDKDISNLKFTVAEMKEENRVNAQEIKMLKLSHDEIMSKSTRKDEEIRTLKRTILELQEEMKLNKQVNNQHGMDINLQKSTVTTIENELKTLTMDDSLRKQILNIERELHSGQDSIKESVQDIKENTGKHIENLENVVFAHKQLQETCKEIQFRWVLQDYLHMFHIGKHVWSPIFYTKIDGYFFQLHVEWSGTNKENLGLYMELKRGKTQHRLLKTFDKEFTLAFHGKNAITSSHRVTSEDIIKLRDECFTINKGYDVPKNSAGQPSLLVSPYDDYILNNSLLISCTIHL